MRHRVAGRHLNRSGGHRRALYRGLMTDLFRYERIQTTQAKALAIRGQAEKLVTTAKRGLARKADGGQDIHARRKVASVLYDGEIVKKLFDEIAPRYAERPGGYTRITKLGPRMGDAAEMVVIELVD